MNFETANGPFEHYSEAELPALFSSWIRTLLDRGFLPDGLFTEYENTYVQYIVRQFQQVPPEWQLKFRQMWQQEAVRRELLPAE